VEPVTSLIELCQRADFLSMHAPLNSETHTMMSEKQFKAMKKTAILHQQRARPTVDEKGADRSAPPQDIAARPSTSSSRKPGPALQMAAHMDTSS